MSVKSVIYAVSNNTITIGLYTKTFDNPHMVDNWMSFVEDICERNNINGQDGLYLSVSKSGNIRAHKYQPTFNDGAWCSNDVARVVTLDVVRPIDQPTSVKCMAITRPHDLFNALVGIKARLQVAEREVPVKDVKKEDPSKMDLKQLELIQKLVSTCNAHGFDPAETFAKSCKILKTLGE